ncbi:hypothetical protein BT96DRAFT_1023510 [Gymnopus androsaceus JB14]|uniref:Uncharacterized protein n=1 Tax=Gymnopus androsaceus JB14 TaxID=1447944 RepID=A0A6A4H2V1_9AGAR|nr:hypothetical protein BT96DRAFT_1023510 [Gymnopus androsaceus JB14]
MFKYRNSNMYNMSTAQYLHPFSLLQYLQLLIPTGLQTGFCAASAMDIDMNSSGHGSHNPSPLAPPPLPPCPPSLTAASSFNGGWEVPPQRIAFTPDAEPTSPTLDVSTTTSIMLAGLLAAIKDTLLLKDENHLHSGTSTFTSTHASKLYNWSPPRGEGLRSGRLSPETQELLTGIQSAELTFATSDLFEAVPDNEATHNSLSLLEPETPPSPLTPTPPDTPSTPSS